MPRPAALVALALLWVTTAASAQTPATTPARPVPTPPPPGLVVEEPSARFGEAYAGNEIAHTFVVRNDGPRPVSIIEIRPNAPEAGDALPGPIPPGGRAQVTVRQPTDRLGLATYRFLLKADDGLPDRRLTLSGFVQSAYEPDQPLLTGDVAPGGVAQLSLQSREVERLEVLEVLDAPPFLSIDVKGRGTDGSVTLRASVAADAPLGASNGTLRLRTNVAQQPTLAVLYRLSVFEDVAPETTTLDLGVIRQGQPFEKTSELRSRSGQDFEVKSVEGAGPDFTVEMAPCTKAAPPCHALLFKGVGPKPAGRITGVVRVQLSRGRELSLPYAALTVAADSVVRDLGALGDGDTKVPGPGTSVKTPAPSTPPTPPPVPPPFQGKPGERMARLSWDAGQEEQAYGFLIYRSDRPDGPFRRVNASIVPVDPGPPPHHYSYEDRGVEPGRSYFYYLESISRSGAKARLSGVVTKVIPPAP